jgi:hypothetical protein
MPRSKSVESDRFRLRCKTGIMIRRTKALVWAAAVSVTLLFAGCTSPTPAPSSPPPTTASAGVDPAASGVPVDGDENLTLQWEYMPGVDPSDPVVDVARRTAAVIWLTHGSAAWNDASRIEALSKALTDQSSKSLSVEEAQKWATADKPSLTYPVRVLVQPPQVDGETASVFICPDLSTFVEEEPVPGSGTGITRIDLAVIDGYWKTTSYDPNTSDWTLEDYQHCEDF